MLTRPPLHLLTSGLALCLAASCADDAPAPNPFAPPFQSAEDAATPAAPGGEDEADGDDVLPAQPEPSGDPSGGGDGDLEDDRGGERDDDPNRMRDVLLVGNGLSGSVSFIDAHTFESLGHVDVIPDLEELQITDLLRFAIVIPIIQSQQLIHHFEPANGERFVDDLFVSPDGTRLYVSRSNLGDVAAFDLTQATHPKIWRTTVEGFKADHATISPDGKQLVVSATTARVADVFDADTGAIVGNFPTGYYPHQNDYSHDGKYIYNSSIGNVGFGAVSYADNDQKGDRWLVKADAKTLEVVRTWQFEYGIRPSVFTPDDKIMYAQLSYLNGVIKYDLEAGQEIARSDQPLSEFALQTYKTYDEYPHDSAHHGLSISGDGKRLCDCGTIDNHVAIVRTDTMQVEKYIDVGMVPYWATTSPDGRYCFVSLSGDDAISVIDFEGKEEVKVVPVGRFPQRSRLGRVPQRVIELLKADGT